MDRKVMPCLSLSDILFDILDTFIFSVIRVSLAFRSRKVSQAGFSVTQSSLRV
jgi:hypothetical protein